MSAKNRREADGGGIEPDTTPPDHRRPTHGVSRFLLDCPASVPVDQLAEAYNRWQRTDDAEQADLGRWSR
jgi:hypothetical protein